MGQEAGIYRRDASAEDAAWRLMAASVGLDMIGQFGGMLGLSTDTFERHLSSAIDRELT
ncbi:TetR family transcriptional regulator [Mycobacteroides abscessus subsp. abscessus]|nr:TetR family transcriptional regulator [Mycobacteroides abscessus subsp. abscessus]